MDAWSAISRRQRGRRGTGSQPRCAYKPSQTGNRGFHGDTLASPHTRDKAACDRLIGRPELPQCRRRCGTSRGSNENLNRAIVRGGRVGSTAADLTKTQTRSLCINEPTKIRAKRTLRRECQQCIRQRNKPVMTRSGRVVPAPDVKRRQATGNSEMTHINAALAKSPYASNSLVPPPGES